MKTFPNAMKTLAEFQEFHRWFDELKGLGSDAYFNMVLLTAEVGEVAQELKNIRWRAWQLAQQDSSPEEAQMTAFNEYRQSLGSELADCLAYLLKLANNAGVDLYEAYVSKMASNVERVWEKPKKELRDDGPDPGKCSG